MTTYTITCAQRQQLIDAFNSVAGKGKRCEAGEKLLQSLEPVMAQQGEPVAEVVHVKQSGYPEIDYLFERLDKSINELTEEVLK
jgi:hypothetical protein